MSSSLLSLSLIFASLPPLRKQIKFLPYGNTSQKPRSLALLSIEYSQCFSKYGIHTPDQLVIRYNILSKANADFRITLLEIGRCRGTLKRRQASDGPFRCTHGIALSLFAETLGGLAVFSRLGPKGKGILLKIETEYIKKAKGMKTL